MRKKIVVLGGGPAGYVAAIRASQLGAEVHLAEEARLGGTCLQAGCIPTKALLHTAAFYRKLRLNEVAGVRVAAELDWRTAQAWKESVVTKLTGGVGSLLQRNGVGVHYGRAKLLTPGKVMAGEELLEADAVILATGAVHAKLPFPGSQLEGVLDSTAALGLEEPPGSMVIVGGGAVGVEFAALYRALGTEITILELLPEILPAVDAEVASCLRGALEADGVRVHTDSRLKGVEKTAGGLSVCFERSGVSQHIAAEKILVCAGRTPNTAGLGLESLGVRMNGKAVEVDEHFESSVQGLYAVGDCNAKRMLAHSAMAQGMAAAEHIMGVESRYEDATTPSCVYSSPEVAAVGLTEKQALEAGYDCAVGRFDLGGNGRALIEGSGGLIKIIADKRLGEVLGVHMIGPRVTEMIAEAALCMRLEGTVEDLVGTVHAHPTVSEAFHEAAMAVFGKPIHSI